MRILITNHWLKKLGGSETFTYTMVQAAKMYGYEVDLFTTQPGYVSQKIRDDFKVGTPILKPSYDLILASHNSCVKHVLNRGPIIQTCHGTIPKLEQPSDWVNAFVAISEEVADHIHKKTNRHASVILNPIDTNRFSVKTSLAPNIKSVLSLSHSEPLNKELSKIFADRGIAFKTLNKYSNPVWSVEREIWQHDLVISLGRGAYESLSCGRPVLVLDRRPYQTQLADGMITPTNIDRWVKCNFSGRYVGLDVPLEKLIETELEEYNDDNELFYRSWAVKNLNYLTNFQKYIDLWKTL